MSCCEQQLEDFYRGATLQLPINSVDSGTGEKKDIQGYLFLCTLRAPEGGDVKWQISLQVPTGSPVYDAMLTVPPVVTASVPVGRYDIAVTSTSPDDVLDVLLAQSIDCLYNATEGLPGIDPDMPLQPSYPSLMQLIATAVTSSFADSMGTIASYVSAAAASASAAASAAMTAAADAAANVVATLQSYVTSASNSASAAAQSASDAAASVSSRADRTLSNLNTAAVARGNLNGTSRSDAFVDLSTTAQTIAGRKSAQGFDAVTVSNAADGALSTLYGFHTPYSGAGSALNLSSGGDWQSKNALQNYGEQGATITSNGTLTAAQLAGLFSFGANQIGNGTQIIAGQPSPLVITALGPNIAANNTLAHNLFTQMHQASTNLSVKMEVSGNGGTNWETLFDGPVSVFAVSARPTAAANISNSGPNGFRYTFSATDGSPTIATNTRVRAIGMLTYYAANDFGRLPVSGGRHFGPLNHSNVAGVAKLNGFQTLGLNRFTEGINATLEGGANAGSDRVFNRYADNGTTLLGTTTYTRSTGLWTFDAGIKPTAASDTLSAFLANTSFTPSLIGETVAGTPTYASGGRDGTYERQGSRYKPMVNIVLSALGVGTGPAAVSGLPATSLAGSSTKSHPVDFSNVTAPAGALSMVARLAANSSTAQLFWVNASGARTRVQMSELSATSELNFRLDYPT